MNGGKKEKENKKGKETEKLIAFLLIIGSVILFTVLAFAVMFLVDTRWLFQP